MITSQDIQTHYFPFGLESRKRKVIIDDPEPFNKEKYDEIQKQKQYNKLQWGARIKRSNTFDRLRPIHEMSSLAERKKKFFNKKMITEELNIINSRKLQNFINDGMYSKVKFK